MNYFNFIFQISDLNIIIKTYFRRNFDETIANDVTQHKEGIITTRQLLDKYINITSKHSLP